MATGTDILSTLTLGRRPFSVEQRTLALLIALQMAQRFEVGSGSAWVCGRHCLPHSKNASPYAFLALGKD